MSPLPRTSALPSRCVTREEAARYCHLTPRGLDAWVKRGIVPGPLPGTQRFDIKALDAALDKLSGLSSVTQETEEDPFEAWERSLEGRA